MKCTLLDVFSDQPLRGNGLAVFETSGTLSTREMLEYTREVRQFESIFFTQTSQQGRVDARVFTMEEELEFAGHPLLGLAAHLHAQYGTRDTHQWQIALPNMSVSVASFRKAHHYHAVMQQDAPDFIGQIPAHLYKQVMNSLSLRHDARADFPIEVISTGLPYLIVPVIKDLQHAHIISNSFESLLNRVGARFVYVLDILTLEGRTWDNQGQVEDIATGSAAGPAAAYLHRHGLLDQTNSLEIQQGRFMHRPCKMTVQVDTKNGRIGNIRVGGDVCEVADITFRNDHSKTS